MKLKKGDKVIVIAGKNQGETGTIVRVYPATDMVLIDGINMVKRHRRATSAGGTGQIVEKPMPIHVSNVMLADPKTGKPTRSVSRARRAVARASLSRAARLSKLFSNFNYMNAKVAKHTDTFNALKGDFGYTNVMQAPKVDEGHRLGRRRLDQR